MEPRLIIHERFVERFQFGARPHPLSDTELDSIEGGLCTKLPLAFRQFMSRYGPVHTPRTLELVTNLGLDHPDIQDFLSADEAVGNSRGYWAAGMPDDVIGVASDCMGNMIGFRRSGEQSDDLPVVFFDHDFATVTELAPSFDECLHWYLSRADGGEPATALDRPASRR
jgi:hypothetical protein